MMKNSYRPSVSAHLRIPLIMSIKTVSDEAMDMNSCRLWQVIPDGKTIPIIAMTANSFAEDVQASLDAGMNAHIAKPIVMDEVIKTILRYVHND